MFFNYSSSERTVNVALEGAMKRPREALGEAAGLQATSSYSRSLVSFLTPVKLHLKKISGLCFLMRVSSGTSTSHSRTSEIQLSVCVFV